MWYVWLFAYLTQAIIWTYDIPNTDFIIVMWILPNIISHKNLEVFTKQNALNAEVNLLTVVTQPFGTKIIHVNYYQYAINETVQLHVVQWLT